MLPETTEETYTLIGGYSPPENDCEAPLEQEEMNRYYRYREIQAPPPSSTVESSRCPSPILFVAEALSGLFDTAKQFLKGGGLGGDTKKEKGGN